MVTGSTGLGLGTEIAKLFAEEGAEVVITGRNEENGQRITREIERRGHRATFVQADLSQADASARIVAHTLEIFGKLTVLVNCAVAANQRQDGTALTVSAEHLASSFRVNFLGPFELCRVALSPMIAAGGGSIVNIGSRTAIRGTPNLAAYSSSKGALHALTRSIAMDFAKSGVRCNTVSPGFITGKERDLEMDSERLAWAQRMHLTAPPTTREVALATLYLASDEAASITGFELQIDGGGSMARGLELG